jgi:hypothetical protein
MANRKDRFMFTRCCSLSLIAIALALPSGAAHAFCGFYVGKADASLFNDASQVVLVRDGDRTVVTMSNDYKGELTDFALVVPVPSVITKDQIHIGDRKYIERLDAYSAPRLVEYHDPNPCAIREMAKAELSSALGVARGVVGGMIGERAHALGVTVEASYAIGEYDILILSAKESAGLETWLRESGYRIPAKASAALAPYIRQDMKFFVAKVNLKNQKAGGFNHLRPIQIAYESPKFMLPIRLGMANARGPQDLVVYALTRKGRVESTNYRTTKMPTGMDVPVFVKSEFPSFYKAAFDRAHRKENGRALLTEHFWNMAWCDPCASEPLSTEELRQLGVFWLDERQGNGSLGGPGGVRFPGPPPVMLTRLHVRYDAEHFPEDLMFQETGDQENFQARYVLRHAFKGSPSCSEGADYRASLARRHQTEARTLADLTGWNVSTIQQKMGSEPATVDSPWYKKIWR